jgi:hypothetical protein
MAEEKQGQRSVERLVGRKWKAVINGKRALNGERYSATYTGDIEAADDDQTIYDVLRELACHIEDVNSEMEHPDSFQVTLFAPNEQGQP